MTDDELKAIEARANAATPIKGITYAQMIYDSPSLQMDRFNQLEVCFQLLRLAKELTHARTDIPLLIAEVRELRAKTIYMDSAYNDFAVKKENELRAAREALPEPGKLEALAKWIDVHFPNDPNPEVQETLRVWASKARKALGEE